jgi:hypothetical protein
MRTQFIHWTAMLVSKLLLDPSRKYIINFLSFEMVWCFLLSSCLVVLQLRASYQTFFFMKASYGTSGYRFDSLVQ